jgi:hypothetical protein
MTAKLCKAGVQFREQVDDCFPERDRRSDGWVADARHVAGGKSDHIPTAQGWVFALDVDRDLNGKSGKPDVMPYLANQVRIAARKDKRIKYVIFDKKIASAKTLWRWVPYRGANPHSSHMHISFTQKGEADGSFFNIPMLGGDE